MSRGQIHSGTLLVDEDCTVRAMVNGTLVVAPGRQVKVAGMVNGTLVIGQDAEVRVTGMVNGSIRNEGGRLTVTGMVNP